MATAGATQVLAFLFKAGGVVQLAAEDSPGSKTLDVPNSDDGVTESIEWMQSVRTDRTEQLLCCAAAPESKLAGVFFEEVVGSDEVKRFLLSESGYLGFARRRSLDATDANTVLLAYREQFPAARQGARRNSPELVRAARDGNAERVRQLLGEGSDPDSADPNYPITLLARTGVHAGSRVTALNFAAGGGFPEIVDALLTAGANPNVLVYHGGGGEGSPLANAAYHGQLKCAELLIAAGADMDFYDPLSKSSVISAAACSKRIEMLLMLLNKGADVHRTPDMPFARVCRGVPLIVIALLEDLKSGHASLAEVVVRLEEVAVKLESLKGRV